MPYSSGTYSLPSGNPVVTGTTISSSTTNTTNSDIATALSTCILKDGTQTITANLPMASHKLTGLSAGTTAGDSVEYGGSPSFTNLAYTGTLTGSTGILNIGSGQIYKDASGNVGIGTSSPTNSGGYGTLTVNGTTGGQIAFNTAGTNKHAIYSSATDLGILNTVSGNIIFSTTNTERMRIDSSGNVGIGTSSPTYKLDIFSNANTTIGTRVTNTNTGSAAFTGLILGNDTGNVQGLLLNSSTNPSYAGANSLSLIQAGAYPIGFVTNNVERMRIDASGNVGIGTSSPNKQLQIQYGSTNSGQLQITNNSTGTTATDGVLFGYDTSNDVIINNQEATATKLYTSGTERMRIDSGGSLYLNTTSQVGNTAQVMGLKFNGATQWGISFGNLNSSNAGSAINFCNYAGTQIGTIQLSASATAYVTSSDYRLKENIQPMVGALDTIAQLKPVTYTWLEDGANGQGFIAHELQEIFPDAVAGEKDAVAEDGSIIPQGIDPSKLVATLTAAIQELKAIIDTQQEQINSLLGK